MPPKASWHSLGFGEFRNPQPFVKRIAVKHEEISGHVNEERPTSHEYLSTDWGASSNELISVILQSKLLGQQ